MKFRFLLSLLFVLTCTVISQAQIDKGSILAGTSVGYSQMKSTNNITTGNVKAHSFIVSPAVGVVIKENLVTGIRFNYLNSTQKSTYDASNSYKQETKNYGASLFIRRYIPLISRLYVFGEGSAFYNIIRETTTETYYTNKNERKGKGWNTGLSITPGISYGVCKKLQVEIGFNSLLNATYGKNKSTYNNYQTDTRNSFSAGISQDNNSLFFIGFQLIL